MVDIFDGILRVVFDFVVLGWWRNVSGRLERSCRRTYLKKPLSFKLQRGELMRRQAVVAFAGRRHGQSKVICRISIKYM